MFLVLRSLGDHHLGRPQQARHGGGILQHQMWAVTLCNPVVYLISSFRWSFFGLADVSLATSLGVIAAFLATCLAVTSCVIRSGSRMSH